MSHYSLHFNDVSLSFSHAPHTFILNHCSLTLTSGEIMALVGESGCGKSMFAKSILGLLPKNAQCSGTFTLNQQTSSSFLSSNSANASNPAITSNPSSSTPLPLSKMSPFAREHFIYLPQSVNCLNPLLKMERQIPLAPNELGQKMTHLYPFQCSGGMLKQAIFSVAQEKPKALALIADEPTVGMDTETAEENLQFLRTYANRGVAVLCITHDIDLALAVADNIAVFYEKKLAEVLPVAHFTPEKLTHPYTKALYHALPQHGFTPPLTQKESL